MTDTYSDLGVRDAIRSLTADECRVMAALDVHHGDPVLARDEAEDAAIERRKRGVAEVDRVSQLEMDLEWTQGQREAAEAAQSDAEEARQAEADRADREADRADGAEAHARSLLAEVVWRQAAERGCDPDVMPTDRLDAIVDSLWDDLEGGVKAEDLTAAAHLAAWEAGQ